MNRLRGTIAAIESSWQLSLVDVDIVEGDLLSQVTLDYKGNWIVSIITRRSVRCLGLKTGDQVEGLVKANEMTLMEYDGGL